MSRGIYILANDRVLDNTIALLNSIRLYDTDTPIVMIPYNNQCQAVANIVTKYYQGQIFDNYQVLENLSNFVNQIGSPSFLDNRIRKLACWFGAFEEFLYIDTDIIVFEKIIENLKYISDYDFLCCDYQHLGGIAEVFTPKILEIFDESAIKNVFNSGFWGSKKEIISYEDVSEALTFCVSHPEYLFLNTGEQPLINYLVIKRNFRIFNIVNESDRVPGNWAGSPHFQQQNHILIDPKFNQPLKFLHWAGIDIKPDCPYWDIWKHYRYLTSPTKRSQIFHKLNWLSRLVKQKFT